MKSMTLAATLLAGALYVVSPVAKADVMFGSLTPTPACGPVSGVGSVCGITRRSPPALTRSSRTALLGCMSSEHFGQLAWQFERMSGSSGLKVQAAIAC